MIYYIWDLTHDFFNAQLMDFRNPGYMQKTCAKTCGTCAGYRQLTFEDGTPFGVAQQITGQRQKDIEALINETEKYMREEVHMDPKYKDVREGCQNVSAFFVDRAAVRRQF